MGSLRELQHALQEKNSELKMKDSRIMALEQELRRKDELVRRLESELDKYRSVLQPNVPSAVGRTRNQRQGISAEPQSAKAVAENSKPLQRHTKTTRQAPKLFLILLINRSIHELSLCVLLILLKLQLDSFLFDILLCLYRKTVPKHNVNMVQKRSCRLGAVTQV